MKLLRHLPNALTSGNLLSGCMGILWVSRNMDESMEHAAWFVWAACLFDFLDGFAARTLKVSTPIGKELDSLADMVSFGVLPSMVLYAQIQATGVWPALAYAGFSIAVFSALRLAQFNIATNQSDSFIGVPTPATALFITGLSFLPAPLHALTENAYALAAVALIFSFLLISPWELLALKFKNFSWTDNKARFTFILLAVFLLAFWQQGAIPVIILLYIVISLLSRALTSTK